jgi:trans-aconitate 2-methyltransferase
MDWNPDQYLRFQREREQPWRDLLALVRPAPEMRVADLGCGPGELTALLHRELAARETVGIDSSRAMIARASAHAGGGVRFEEGDLAAFAAAEPFDLIFSNAALHWLPEHGTLLKRLASALAPGGQLAVQVPDMDGQPTHETAREVAQEPQFRGALRGYVRRSPILEPDEYSAWLHRLGFAEQHVRLQIYPHLLPSRESALEWVKGSLLTDYEKRLPTMLFAKFLARYRELLLPRLVDDEPFFFAYRRVLIWGRKP